MAPRNVGRDRQAIQTHRARHAWNASMLGWIWERVHCSRQTERRKSLYQTIHSASVVSVPAGRSFLAPLGPKDRAHAIGPHWEISGPAGRNKPRALPLNQQRKPFVPIGPRSRGVSCARAHSGKGRQKPISQRPVFAAGGTRGHEAGSEVRGGQNVAACSSHSATGPFSAQAG